MRIRVLSLLFVLVLTLGTAAHDLDITGKWRGTAATGTEIALDLATDGSTVTGTVSLNRADPRPISDGRFEDNHLSFTMPSMFGNDTVTVSGTLEENELALVLESERGTTTARLKREPAS
ncbi:MAG TPA: hypothetical protein PKK95_09895 [Vicinamibacterales bacterium]|nr:hypothetical protein [Acidobacteriota bacterium]HOC18571.1 hypothetical protein [Vicinamibacterales bacterium]